jgi:hypothetical protein
MEFPGPDDRLDSWKEIAGFLGRTVRTVQRWEKTAGLPVRRGGAGPRSSVIASKRELSDWWLRRRDKLNGEPEPPNAAELPAASVEAVAVRSERRRSTPVVVVVAVLVIVAAGNALSRRLPGAAGEPPLSGRFLTQSTSESHEVRRIELTSPAAHLAVSPDAARLYASLPDERAIDVIDIAAGRVVDRLPGVDGTGPLELTGDGRLLIAGGATMIAVIDVARRTVRTLPVEHSVWDLESSADGGRVWTTHGQGGLRVIDTATMRVSPVQTIGCPMFLAYGPRTRRMFVSYQCHGPGGQSGHDAVEAFDEPTATSLMTESGVPLVGSRLILSPDEQYLWADTHDACSSTAYDQRGCPSGSGPVVVTFRSRTLEPLAMTRYPTENAGPTFAFTADGSRVVMSDRGVHVIDAALGRIEESLALDASGDVVMSPRGDRAFVSAERHKAILDLPVQPGEDARALPGLVTYWTGDGTANDLLGGMYPVASHPRSYAPGRLGSAFAFDGSSPGVSFGTRLDLDLPAELFTLGAWIRPRQDGLTSAIVARASFRGWRWWLSDGRPAFCFERAPASLACRAGGLHASRALGAEAWHHVAVTRSASRLALFIDGARVASVSLDGYVSPPGSGYDEDPVLRLGADTNGKSRFSGLVDEVTFFRGALDEVGLARLMVLTTAAKRPR